MLKWVLERTETERWALGVVAFLASGIIIQWFSQRLNHALAIERERQNRFKAVSAKFISEVHTALIGLYPHPTNWPSHSIDIDPILRKTFPALTVAVAEFRPFVPWYRRWLFDKDWLRYRCSTGREIDIQCYHHYMPFISTKIVKGIFRNRQVTIDTTNTHKEAFKKNVGKLLSYANPT